MRDFLRAPERQSGRASIGFQAGKHGQANCIYKAYKIKKIFFNVCKKTLDTLNAHMENTHQATRNGREATTRGMTMAYFVLFLALSTLFVAVPAWIIRNGDWETIFQAVMVTVMALFPVSIYQSFFGG